MRTPCLLLVLVSALFLTGCDERQPTSAPGSSQAPSTTGSDQGSPQTPAGGIPAGQAQPQRPQ